jgi:hypothetical protein
MIRSVSLPNSSIRGLILASTLAVALVACKTAPPERPALPLQLLESAQLYVPDGCAAETSVRIDFVVLENGRTERVRMREVPPCLREALVAWVESFRYAPPGSPTDESVEWLMVTGRRGS